MNISWNINEADIKRVKDFVNQNDNPFVTKRRERNVNRQNIKLDKDSLILNLVMCLLTSQQRSGPNTPVGKFFQRKPFPITIQTVLLQTEINKFIIEVLKQNGLNRFITKISQAFVYDLKKLQANNWEIIEIFQEKLDGAQTKIVEREVADYIDDLLIGFGPKQSRNFLQGLGLTKYEIPIDSRITGWLNDFGFPVTLTSSPLQDKGYYHFISDGVQQLCEQADIYPCILDAAIFSSFDKGEWTFENSIY
jgi:hypothetical protein